MPAPAADEILTNVLNALIDRLKSDTVLQSYVGAPPRVFDHQPQNTTFPFVTVTIKDCRDAGAKGLSAYNMTLQIEAIHRDSSLTKARQILGRIRHLLHDAADVANVVRCQEEYVGYLKSRKGQHATARYRVITA